MKKFTTIILTTLFSASIHAQTLTVIKDINAGGDGINQQHMQVGDKVFFVGSDATSGRELWVTDGTSAGTTLVKDITPGATSTVIILLLGTYQNRLVFMADDGVHGREPWITDGTAAGTFLLKDINPGSNSSTPLEVTECGGKFFFQADDEIIGSEPWMSDGTSAGTTLVADVQPGASGSNPQSFIEYNGNVYFSAHTTLYSAEPWVTNLASGTTTLFMDIQPGNGGNGGFNAPIILNNQLLFVAFTNATGNELWKTDGNPNNTNMITDINQGSAWGVNYTFKMFLYNNKVYFGGNDGSGLELWATDGSTATKIKELHPAAGVDLVPTGFFEFKNKLYFQSLDAAMSGATLWCSNGTTNGTVKVSPLNAASPNLVSQPTIFKDSIYYFDYGTSNGSTRSIDLFVTGGDSTSVRMIPRPIPSAPTPISSTDSWIDTTATGIVFHAQYFGGGFEPYTLLYTPPPTNTQTLQQKSIQVYPNPVTDVLHIAIDKSYSNAFFSIVDIMGKEVLRVDNAKQSDLKIDVKTLLPGTYFLIVKDQNQQLHQTFIKQ